MSTAKGWKWLRGTALVALFAANAISGAALSDDWEIYTGTSGTSGTVKPNIVLLLDTSNSMTESSVKTVREPYNPDKTYPAISRDGETCRDDVIYYSNGDDIDDLTALSAGCDSIQYVKLENFQCQAAVEALNTVGQYHDAWSNFDHDEPDGAEWEHNVDNSAPSDRNESGAWHECYGDHGKHGRAMLAPTITWHDSDPDTPGNDGLAGATITVPNMSPLNNRTAINIRENIDKLSPAQEPWVAVDASNAIQAEWWVDPPTQMLVDFVWTTIDVKVQDFNDDASGMTYFHPNYIRWLKGYEDLNGNGNYDSGEEFAYEINQGKRLEVLQEVMGELVDSWQGIRVAVMRYAGNHGSAVMLPALDIDCADGDVTCDYDTSDGLTNRQVIRKAVTGFYLDKNQDGDTNDSGEYNYDSGGTPHTEAIWEAYNYLRGGPVEFGHVFSTNGTYPERRTNPKATWAGLGFEGSGLDGNVYRSPITHDCQANFIVHMTDGGSTNDGGAQDAGPEISLHGGGKSKDVDTAIKALPDFNSLSDSACEFTNEDDVWSGIDGDDPDNSGRPFDSCADELTEYMATQRRPVTILNSEGNLLTLPEPQPIETYVIGFEEDNQFLSAMGEKGRGDSAHSHYFTATYKDELKSAFNLAVQQIKDEGTEVISAPGVAVEAYSRSMHLNDLYFNLYEPTRKPRYGGNLKRYKLATDGSGNPIIAGADNKNAVDPTNGRFRDDAISFWSPETDGGEVSAGGAVSRYPADRNVYTWIAGNTTDLTANVNSVHESNAANIPADGSGLNLAAEEIADKEKYLKWARGLDAFNPDSSAAAEIRRDMGDPLHSIPVVVIYDANSADPEHPDAAVFTMTNDGFLHSIDMETGEENWAYIPQELLRNVRLAVQNAGEGKIYGLDGRMLAWQHDANGNGSIDGSDFAHLFFGMRRGGRNYYALDVTSKNAPRYLWSIAGGVDAGFENLGETWSRMHRGKIRIGGTDKDVLIFTGGYDSAAYDDKPTLMPTTDTGNAIYIVDRATGSPIWIGDNRDSPGAASVQDHDKFADMNFAIPADPAVVDMNDDGYTDRIYAVDIAGQLWRIDIHNGATGSGLVTGGRIISLGGDATSDKRHFFNSPDVVTLNDRVYGRTTTINIGSGNRDKPGSISVDDMFFSVRDPNNPIGTTSSYQPAMSIDDLKNVTTWPEDDASTAIDEEQAFVDEIFTLYDGWYFELPHTGEKNLAPSVTVNGEILFTTYEPPSGSTAIGCYIDLGTARLYSVSVRSGKATQQRVTTGEDIDGDADRGGEIQYEGIPPGVVVMFPMATGGDPVAIVGTSINEPNFSNKLRRTYWYIDGRRPGN